MSISSDNGDEQSALGTKIKLQRIKNRLSAKALAERINVSPSLISKIETGAMNPSVDVLRKIVAQLGLTMVDLMDSEPAKNASVPGRRARGQVSVVRANERKLLHMPLRGITFQMLTPNVQGPVEFLWVEMEPGEGRNESYAHLKGMECVLVLEGVLTLEVENELYTLNRGDCVTFDATQLHRYRNEGTEKAVWLGVAIPPTL